MFEAIAFLMYRVELKVGAEVEIDGVVSVPNVPCGVERIELAKKYLDKELRS